MGSNELPFVHSCPNCSGLSKLISMIKHDQYLIPFCFTVGCSILLRWKRLLLQASEASLLRNGSFQQLSACKWRQLQEGLQPGKAQIRYAILDQKLGNQWNWNAVDVVHACASEWRTVSLIHLEVIDIL